MRAFRVLTALGASLIVLQACDTRQLPADEGRNRSQALQNLLIAADQRAAGSEDGADGLRDVLSARISRNERQVLVLDRVEPLLKIFEAQGRLISASINSGDGPNELQAATNVAVSSTHAVIVGRGHAAVRDLGSGSLYVTRPGHVLFDVGFDCDDRLLGYDPDRQALPNFVHVLKADSGLPILTSAFPNPRPSQIGWHRSIFGTSDGSLIVYRKDFKVQLAFMDCAGDLVPRGWEWAVATFPSQAGSPLVGETRNGSRITQTFSAAEPLFAGAADLDGRLLWVETRMAPSASKPATTEDYEYRTYFYLVDPEVVRVAYVTGSFSLEDVSANYLLLKTGDPWPRVLLIGRTDLVRAVEQSGAVSHVD